MNTIQIIVGEHEITFHSHVHWVNTAKNAYATKKLSSETSIAIDAQGRICNSGKEMKRAKDQDAFPVNVYRKTFE